MKNYLIIVLALLAALTFSMKDVMAEPVFAPDEMNNIFFNNAENWVDVDNTGEISVGDYFYGILHVQNIDGIVSGTIWNEDNVTPGLDTFTGYFLTDVTGVSIHDLQPHITLGTYTGGSDPNGVLSDAEIANGVVLKLWTDTSTKWTDFNDITTDIANSTDTAPWAAFTTDGGYWYTHAPFTPPAGVGNTVGNSFMGLKIVDNFSGLTFAMVNDTNEGEIDVDVHLAGQSELEVGDNHWGFQSNDPVFINPIEPLCGDGILDPGETCDPPGLNAGQPNECRADCTFCGDNILDPVEDCDDGNNVDGDGCSAVCTFEGGGQGCTPGYWKQSHHFDSWTAPYTPNTLFSNVFENAFPGKTLLQVLWQGGGGLKALGRHTVAALLNAASPNADYDFSTNDVINMFNDVYPGSKQDYNSVKNTLENFNEQVCPLN